MGQDYDQLCFVLKNAKELPKKNFKDIFSWRTLEFFGKFTKFWSEILFFRERLNFPENLRIYGAKTFFFLENTFASCPWSWAFLPLASRESVLGRTVVGLGFFCVLGLEPCPWLHLISSSIFLFLDIWLIFESVRWRINEDRAYFVNVLEYYGCVPSSLFEKTS